MKRRIFALIVCFAGISASAQFIDVGQFPGKTVADKVKAAQAACWPGLACVLTLGPDLGQYAQGTLPLKCALCSWQDYRATPPTVDAVVPSAAMPALTGDVTSAPGTPSVTTVAKVNGVAYAAAPATDTVAIVTAANTSVYKAIVNCGDALHALAYSTTTHSFACQAIAANAAQEARQIVPSDQSAVTVSGTVSQGTLNNVGVIQLDGAAPSSISVSFVVPNDAAAQPLVLAMNVAAASAPGITNNKSLIKLTCTINNTALAQTVGDTITLTNDVNWVKYVATNNVCGGATFSIGDLVQLTIYRDTTVSNNMTQQLDIGAIRVNYTSVQ